MTIKVRKMVPSERPIVQQISRAAFHSAESWFIGLPQQALVLLVDQTIVGAVVYQTWGNSRYRNAYVDQFVIAPGQSGRGLGKRLLTAALTYFRQVGIQTVTAAVKTDNVGSWKNFLDNEFRRVSWGQAFRYLGAAGTVRQLSQSPLAFEAGMELYVLDLAERPASPVGLPALGRFLVSNLLLQLPMWGLLMSRRLIWPALGAYVLVLLVVAGTRWGLGRWLEPHGHLRFNNGGGITTLLLSLVQVPFPLNLTWVPVRYQKDDRFRRHLALPEIVKWGCLMALAPLVLSSGSGLFFIGKFASWLLVFQLFPVFPFEAFGGRRLYDYRPSWWGVTSGLTVIELMGLWLI